MFLFELEQIPVDAWIENGKHEDLRIGQHWTERCGGGSLPILLSAQGAFRMGE